MKKMSWTILTLAVLITLTWTITCKVFESPFAEATIDWFAFLAGIFLAVEGVYKILRAKDPLFRDQLLRTFRVIAGTCIFTIHLLQFMRF